VYRVIILSKSEIEKSLKMNEALKAVEKALNLQREGNVVMPPKIYLDLPKYEGNFRAMPAYIDGYVGIKWVSVYPNNHSHNLPSVLATIILCDPNTGQPLAIMDGTCITAIRTGAIGGVAVKYLARQVSSVIGIIGAGMQAKTQLMAVSQVLPKIKEVKVFDQYREASLKYVMEMGAELNLNIRPVDTIEQASEADILVTTTPSRRPVIKKQYVKPGTHINAIGADAAGKQEFEGTLLKNAKIVVDDIEQASHSGEINIPLSKGQIKIDDIYSTLGDIVANIKKGRENETEITIFDSTGLAIQDIACAKMLYEKLKGAKLPAVDF
jgi:alanine dehydrogenase